MSEKVGQLVNTVSESFNTTEEQLTDISQWKKIPSL